MSEFWEKTAVVAVVFLILSADTIVNLLLGVP